MNFFFKLLRLFFLNLPTMYVLILLININLQNISYTVFLFNMVGLSNLMNKRLLRKAMNIVYFNFKILASRIDMVFKLVV